MNISRRLRASNNKSNKYSGLLAALHRQFMQNFQAVSRTEVQALHDPGSEAAQGVEGTSLMPLLKKPNRPWKTAVFSQYPRSHKGHRHSGHGDIMGYAVRTKKYRYVEWREWKTGSILARELYDQRLAPSEMHNIAGVKGQAGVVNRLEKILAGGWQALPSVNGR